MKHLIGYVLIKPEYEKFAVQICNTEATYEIESLSPREDGTAFSKDSNCKRILEKAGVLDLWFEPVYVSTKYKIGDYLYCLKDGGNESSHKNYNSDNALREGDVQKIVSFEVLFGDLIAICDLGGIARIEKCDDYFRKATPEEISGYLNVLKLSNGLKVFITEERVKIPEGTFIKNSEIITLYERLELIRKCKI